jgi:hypothetical protein
VDLKVDLCQDSLAKPRGSLRLGKIQNDKASSHCHLPGRSQRAHPPLSGPRLPIIHSIKKYRPAPIPLRKFQQPRRAPPQPAAGNQGLINPQLPTNSNGLGPAPALSQSKSNTGNPRAGRHRPLQPQPAPLDAQPSPPRNVAQHPGRPLPATGPGPSPVPFQALAVFGAGPALLQAEHQGQDGIRTGFGFPVGYAVTVYQSKVPGQAIQPIRLRNVARNSAVGGLVMAAVLVC